MKCLSVAGVLSLSLLVWGCNNGNSGMDHRQETMRSAGDRPLMMMDNMEASEAIAVLHPLGLSKVTGTVHFTQMDGKVKVIADISGLEPGTSHGFHVHEFGDCSSPDGSSAGGHYNPEGHQHAGTDTPQRHAGDLGNIKADETGKAHLELTVDNITIAGAKDPIIGRGVIVHEKADDLKSQPTGNAGGRIACGVIGIAKPATPGK